jgi:uncharacterized repeat protein (TIGR04052 family)
MALSALALGCGDSSQQVEIGFAAVVGEEPFVCGEEYHDLGANSSSLVLSDFRFYVQDVELKSAGGDWVAVDLAQNNFQIDNVALLDFENCGELGTPEQNDRVVGTVPQDEYEGIRFRMGVPVDLNHADASTAPGPLGVTSMFWNWRGGYKFLRIDSGAFSMNDWRMHLGSTGCGMGAPTIPPAQACTNENRVDVELDSFAAENDTVVADFAALVDGAPIDKNAEGTPVGCMAAPDDPDCGPIFENLGLAFGDQQAGTQIFFSAE